MSPLISARGALAWLVGLCLMGLAGPVGAQECVPAAGSGDLRRFTGRVLTAEGILNEPVWALRVQPDEPGPPAGLELLGPPRHDPPGHVAFTVPSRCRARPGARVVVTYRFRADAGPEIVSVLPADPPRLGDPDRIDGYERLWTGHRALVDGRWDDALRYYRAALRHGSRFGGLDVLIGAVETRRQLGAIAPADTHRIGAIYVSGITTLDGRGGHATRPDVLPEEQEEWRIYLGVMRRLVEAFSHGAWTLDIDERLAMATVDADAELAPPNPDHLGLGRFFFTEANAYDTFIVFSNTTSPSRGLARRYPHVEGVLYGPDRGMAAVGTRSLLLLFHEFFHVIEWVSGGIGGPVHGYRDEVRGAFPGWTGDSELDYYRWHFAETLPRIGWTRLNHRLRWRVPEPRPVAAWETVTDAYAAVPLHDRQAARRLATEARALAASDPAAALARYERALALSPYAPEALEPAIRLYREAGRSDEADRLAERLRLARLVTAVEQIP